MFQFLPSVTIVICHVYEYTAPTEVEKREYSLSTKHPEAQNGHVAKYAPRSSQNDS